MQIPKRKYPFSHAIAEAKRTEDTPQDPFAAIDYSFLSEISAGRKKIVDQINSWIEKNSPKPIPEQTAATSHPSAVPSAPSDAESDTLSCEELGAILAAILDATGFDIPDPDDAEREKELAKLPLYAGPPDLFFGSDSIFGDSAALEKKETRNASDTPTGDDHRVIYG